MNDQDAIRSLAALAQEHRLKIFRTLMSVGPLGLSAGEIAEKLDLGASKVSFHLGHLERAGLLGSWRVHRHIYYAVNVDGMRELLGFLTRDCCNGHPEICGSLFAEALEDSTREMSDG
ncbi:MAG: helix-turn-helix domain-containing protein [Alphaproteobacteria bacterium]|nr:helix-turn-helix domain-containing protein [Alphaproteobacteria bacterium]